MRDSLVNKSNIFRGLQVRQVVALLDVLQRSDLRTIEYIRKRYLERAPRFETTLQFMTEIEAILCDDGLLSMSIGLRENIGHITNHDLAQDLVDLVVRTNNRYQREVLRYLSQFRVCDHEATHRPSMEQRSIESPIRNFLMELKVVVFDKIKGQYVIPNEHNALYAMAISQCNLVSPLELQSSQRRRENLGSAAEIAIVSYERQRLGAEYADSVDHVARRNVAAGYDIQSVSVCEGNRIIPRFIEVKAVPPETFHFYLTSNEMKAAESLASWYYLYLLPIGNSGIPILEELQIIQDPHSVVLCSADTWIVVNEVVRCSRAIVQRQ